MINNIGNNKGLFAAIGKTLVTETIEVVSESLGLAHELMNTALHNYHIHTMDMVGHQAAKNEVAADLANDTALHHLRKAQEHSKAHEAANPTYNHDRDFKGMVKSSREQIHAHIQEYINQAKSY